MMDVFQVDEDSGDLRTATVWIAAETEHRDDGLPYMFRAHLDLADCLFRADTVFAKARPKAALMLPREHVCHPSGVLSDDYSAFPVGERTVTYFLTRTRCGCRVSSGDTTNALSFSVAG